MSVVDSECFYNHMSERICDVQRLQESSSLKTVVIAKKNLRRIAPGEDALETPCSNLLLVFVAEAHDAEDAVLVGVYELKSYQFDQERLVPVQLCRV